MIYNARWVVSECAGKLKEMLLAACHDARTAKTIALGMCCTRILALL